MDPKSPPIHLKSKYKDIWNLALPYQDARNDAGHGKIVTEYAMKICDLEKTDPDVVVPAAILHDIGWSQLSKKERMIIFNKNNPKELRLQMRYKHQEEGVKLAREILAKVKWPQDQIEEICEIISQHDTREGFISANEGAMRDADKLYRFDNHGFREGAKNSRTTYEHDIIEIEKYFENPQFFYFESSKKLALTMLEELKKKYV